MFFDIEDYTTLNRYIEDQIGIWNPTAAQIFDANGAFMGDPQDYATTYRATRDYFIKSVTEFYLSNTREVSIEKFELVNAKYEEFQAAYTEFSITAGVFWQAYGSFPFYGQGLVEGDDLTVISNGEMECTFKIMTQAIYDNYFNSLKAMMAKVKEMIELAGDYTI